ncbi:MAG: TRAP transporter small permease subunit [Alphaproteobacteria bacterium]|nr:TRAP transporter small permease subunit [Alphaproteobacteria bacterium]
MTARDPAQRPALAALRRGLFLVGRIELLIAVAAFAFVGVLTTAQVVLRYAFAGSIWWAQEVAQLAMLVSYFFGIAYVVKANQDVAIKMVVERFPERLQRRIYVATQLLVAAFCVVVAFQGLRLAPQQLAFKTYILNIPKFYSTLPLIVGSMSMAATAAYFALAACLRWRDDPAAPDLATLEGELAILHETTGEA